MRAKIKNIIQRALKNGFDLSEIKNYNSTLFRDKIYTYLVSKKYFCFAEDDVIVVSDFTLDDLAELEIRDYHLKVTPLREEGMFDLIIEIFHFVADNPDLKTEDEATTEEVVIQKTNDDDEDSSGEFDWI